jgi:plasmid stabilization system protein ParE
VFKIIISIKAKKDIKDCYDYIYDVLKNEIAADLLLDKIEKSFRLIEIDPEHFPETNDDFLDLLDIRYIQVGNYLCFYNICNEKNEINIIRFMYGKRDWKEILKNLP